MASSSPRVLIVYGTRPEAIKLAPVVRAAQRHDDWSVAVCNTGQHRELLDGVTDTLGLTADHELAVMEPGQGLNRLTARLLTGLDEVLTKARPDWVISQGDTTTAMVAALAAFHRGIPAGHVEAGLRTGDLSAPFPEEANRQLVGRVARLHFAPTPGARQALLHEGIPDGAVAVTGNTVVDAVQWMADQLPKDGSPPVTPDSPDAALLRFTDRARRLVLITGHRRESFDGGLSAVCGGIAALAKSHPDTDFVYPVHLNPRVRESTEAVLGGLSNVHCIAPVGYASAVWLMGRSHCVITDSGGLQEEAPVLGKPVLVTRVSTERPEGVEQGCAVIVGYDAERLVATATAWLDDDAAYRAVAPRVSPYGDGKAGLRIVARLRAELGLPHESVEVWP